MIFIPINSICHLHTREDFELFFACVHEHMDEESRFIIDVFNPDLRILLRDPNKKYPVSEYIDPDTKELITVTETNVYDAGKQMNRIIWHYTSEGGKVVRQVENNMRIFYPQELKSVR